MRRTRPEALSDDALLDALARLDGEQKQRLAVLLSHLAEVDARGLYAERGFSSLHRYCTDVLNMSDDEAYNRIRVARAGRRFPAVLDEIAEGRLHLTGARLLAPHLDEANARELLAEAAGQSRRDIEAMLARRFPKPDVATTFRKLRSPKPAGDSTRNRGDGERPVQAAAPEGASSDEAPGGSSDNSASEPEELSATSPTAAPLRLEPSPAPARIEPLAPERYRVSFTAPQSMVDALQTATALLSHTVPVHDVAAVLERCLDIACEQLVKRKYGAKAVKPRGEASDTEQVDEGPTAEQPVGTADADATPADLDANSAGSTPLVSGPVQQRRSTGAVDTDAGPAEPPCQPSRYIPADVRAEVWRRDGGRCTYTDPMTGRTCNEKLHLELHHIVPWARGGTHDASLITLHCRTHNDLAARRDFSDAHIDGRIAARRAPPAPGARQ